MSASQARDVCPAEHAGWLSTPLRRAITSPSRILGGFVRPGDTVVDLGCGPGFFTLPLAGMVGDGGSVIAVDLQAAMLDKVRARAERKGLAARIKLHHCPPESLDLDGELADFALAFWMVHEVPDAASFFGQVAGVLRQGARCLVVEPKGHVGNDDWAGTLDLARGAGLRPGEGPRVAFSRSALLTRTRPLPLPPT